MNTRHKHVLILFLVVAITLVVLVCFFRPHAPASDDSSDKTTKEVFQNQQSLETITPTPNDTVSEVTQAQSEVTQAQSTAAKLPDEANIKLPPASSTVQDLIRKGLPIISNPRKLSYTQTAAESTAEVVADLGNGMIMSYCYLGRSGSNISMPNELLHYSERIMPNIKVIRLIEEGRNDPAKVSSLLKDAVRQCLENYDKDVKGWHESRARGESPSGTGDNEEYYNKNRKYECPQMEFRRINYVANMSLYILANIGQLDADLLAKWIEKEKPQLYDCRDMDLWLVDAYFRQDSQSSSDVADQHKTLTKGINIAGHKTIQSKWNAIWDIHDRMFKAARIDTSDIKTIETLGIPPQLPAVLDKKAKSQIFQNFLEYAGDKASVIGTGPTAADPLR